MFYSKAYAIMLDAKPWHRYITTVLFIVLLLLIWLFLLYFPLYKRFDEVQAQIMQQRKDIQTYIKEQEALKKLSTDYDLLKHDLQRNKGAFDTSVQTRIAEIVTQLTTAGLKLESLKTTKKINKGWYTTVRIVLQATGSLNAIQSFFDVLQTNNMLVQCTQATLEHAEHSFLLHCTLKFLLPNKKEQNKSPSTLEKAEGLGG